MKETVNICESGIAAIAILKALVNDNKIDDFFPEQGKGGNCEVELFINGKPASWKNAITELWKAREEEVNKRVGKKLSEILSCKGIKETIDEINNIQYILRDKIEQLAGEKIEWSEDYC